MTIQKNKIKEIIRSETGRRLILCLALYQPITSYELKHFVDLTYHFFYKNKKYSDYGETIPVNVSNKKNKQKNNFELLKWEESHLIFENHPVKMMYKYRDDIKKYSLPDLFTNDDLFVKNKILQKAVSCGLIIKIPERYDLHRNNYYFLNSDIRYIINKNGLEITEDTSSFCKQYNHNVRINVDRKVKLRNEFKEIIAVPNQSSIINEESICSEKSRIYSLPFLLNLFKWSIQYPEFIKEVVETFEEYESVFINKKCLSTWKKAKFKVYKAIEDGILLQHSQRKDILLNKLPIPSSDNIVFRFARSYEIPKCFSNFNEVLVSDINNWMD